GVTLHSRWFFFVEFAGTFVFALSGLLLARREGYDLFGAFVLASLPAMGGGVLRDLLTERHPVWILRSPFIYLYVVLAVVLGGALIYKTYDWLSARRPDVVRKFSGKGRGVPERLVGICDALGLS